jgi:hypothetical protein
MTPSDAKEIRLLSQTYAPAIRKRETALAAIRVPTVRHQRQTRPVRKNPGLSIGLAMTGLQSWIQYSHDIPYF